MFLKADNRYGPSNGIFPLETLERQKKWRASVREIDHFLTLRARPSHTNTFVYLLLHRGVNLLLRLCSISLRFHNSSSEQRRGGLGHWTCLRFHRVVNTNVPDPDSSGTTPTRRWFMIRIRAKKRFSVQLLTVRKRPAKIQEF